MREMRDEFENVALVDDIQQKRATRRDTRTIRNADSFEGYLTIMSKRGTYGGEPELCAFVRCYDQDVVVHLPRGTNPESLNYDNHYRAPNTEAKPKLHICYDNKIVNAHYDSARKNSPDKSESHRSAKTHPNNNTEAEAALTSRAARHHRADMMKSMMLESLTESDRATSPSISSSQRSTSSKRSFEDDGEPQRASKRTDRKHNARIRSAISTSSQLHPTSYGTKLNSGLATPASTQDGDYSSDQSDQSSKLIGSSLRQRQKLKPQSSSRSVTPDNVVNCSGNPRAKAEIMNYSTMAADQKGLPYLPRKGLSTRKQSVNPDNNSGPATIVDINISPEE